ncbi:MAG: DUF4258 domain-containing protein [Bacteroidetes bacterium]|nr:DUF4258 domain-containing protein [Bacteroidota bacterium]
MNGYTLSRHAEHMLEERGIKLDWLDFAMQDPSIVEPDPVDSELEHRLRRIPEFGNRILRVVVKHGDPPLVVTAFFDRSRRNDPKL